MPTTTKLPATQPGLRLPASWPFDVRRVPGFYGWVIWILSTLGFLFSVPGQTMGMGVFTDSFIEAFGLTRTQLSSAYFFGTLGSALLLTWAGRQFDRHGARTLLVLSSLTLGAVLLVISVLGNIIDWATDSPVLGLSLSPTVIGFVLILLCYFGVRFSGQGVLTSASRNVLLVWFDRRRGLVSGIRGVFVSLGFSLAPLGLAMLIDRFGWQGALWLQAAVLIGGYALLALFFIRDNPESCGLQADGAAPSADAPAPRYTAANGTLRDAQRSPLFWIYALGLSTHALFGTAVTFHVVDVFAEAGRSRADAFGYFFPAAVVSTSVNLLASTLVDARSLKPFLLTMLGGFVLGALGLLLLDQSLGYWLLVVGFGLGGGLWGVLSNLANIRFFGSLHLGEISGFNTAISVFASAIGPVAFSLTRDTWGSYHGAVLCCLVANLVLLGFAILVKHPDHNRLSPQQPG